MENSTQQLSTDERYATSPQCFWDRLNLNMKISRWERFIDENGKMAWRDKNNPNEVVYEKPIFNEN
jgi:hypothetical protein